MGTRRHSQLGTLQVTSRQLKDTRGTSHTLHLILGGHIIGTIEESCSAQTWLSSASRLLDRLKSDFDKFKSPEFLGRSDYEIFELVWKANQSESEFLPEYHHLPQLNNVIWSYCALHLDETIDAYLITITGHGDKIKLIWKGWREPCPLDEIDKLHSVTVDKNLLIKTLSDCVKYVNKDFQNYKELTQ